MSNSLEDFPSMEKVLAAIEKFKTYDWPKYHVNDNIEDYLKKINDIITSELGIIILPFLVPKASVLNKYKIFRVREIQESLDINFVCEHSYAPRNITNKLGRCNFPMHPVFYGSDHPGTALIEVIKDGSFKKRIYCISRWEVRNIDEDVIFRPFLGDIDKDHPYKKLKDGFNKKVEEELDILNEDQKYALKIYLDFIANLFVNSDNYSLSAYFAHQQLYASHDPKVEVLMYPSVQTGNRGSNFAIHPNFVDRMMSLKRLYIIRVNSINLDKGTTSIDIIKYGEFDRSGIVWNSITPIDEKYKRYFREDFDDELGFNFMPQNVWHHRL